MTRRDRLVAVAAVAVALSMRVSAQSETYKARLSPTPIESVKAGAVTGVGSVTATLAGRSLAVRGTFDGMRSPATIAQIHLGPRGVRGPVLFDVTVTKAASGTLSGTFILTPELVEAVKRSRFYIQIHSESSADGNLWGWLLPLRPAGSP